MFNDLLTDPRYGVRSFFSTDQIDADSFAQLLLGLMAGSTVMGHL